MLGMYVRLKSRLENREEGQGLVEYALILVLISVVTIVALTTLGTLVNSTIVAVGNAF